MLDIRMYVWTGRINGDAAGHSFYPGKSLGALGAGAIAAIM